MADFRERFGPWYPMRESMNVDDRRDEPWPWTGIGPQRPQYTPTDEETGMRVLDSMQAAAPQRLTPLARDAGVNDVKTPTPEELIRFLISVDMYNAVSEEAEPLKRMNDPLSRR